MNIKCVDYIPTEKFARFMEILNQHHGWLLSEPVKLSDSTIRINFKIAGENYASLQIDWQNCLTVVYETHKNQAWRTFLRRIGLARFV